MTQFQYDRISKQQACHARARNRFLRRRDPQPVSGQCSLSRPTLIFAHASLFVLRELDHLVRLRCAKLSVVSPTSGRLAVLVEVLRVQVESVLPLYRVVRDVDLPEHFRGC
jgi:hypothetical protein